MDKLLPCPFCGGEAELIERTIHGEPDCHVRCKNMCVTQCGKWSEDGCYLNISKEEAIAAWNRRANLGSCENELIVRCENCKHYNRMCCSDGCGWCERMDRGVHDDFYCSNGERKESEGST